MLVAEAMSVKLVTYSKYWQQHQGGYGSTGATRSFSLEGLSHYLVAVSTVGASNTSGSCLYLVGTGAGSSNSGTVYPILQHSACKDIQLNGLTLTVTAISQYTIVSLTKLN